MNYFLYESAVTGKGANTTISYVHDFLKNHGAGETDVHLHAGNCSGQYKNNYVLWYWCWRVIHGLHESVRYSFLVAGHTKFSPNWCFGLMKQRLRRTLILSLFDILEANDKSTLSGVNCGKLVGLHDGSVLIKTYDWANYLAPYFKKLNGISTHHHFRFNKHDPGKVFYREYADSSEREFQLLKDINKLPPPPHVLPPQVLPSGLDQEQRRYLHKEIREFCRFSGARSNIIKIPSLRPPPPPHFLEQSPPQVVRGGLHQESKNYLPQFAGFILKTLCCGVYRNMVATFPRHLSKFGTSCGLYTRNTFCLKEVTKERVLLVH